MRFKTLAGARQIALASAAAVTVSFGAAGAAGAAPSYGGAHAAPTRAASSASVANDTLTITGTAADDNVSIALAADPNVLNVDFNNGSPVQPFDRSTFSAISVFLDRGNDTFAVVGTSPDEFLTVNGGSGDDSITTGSANDFVDAGSGNDKVFTGAGDDVIDAGRGNDSVIGGTGHDTAFLGSGRDSFVWNPGEGSDFVEGNEGVDTLVFNGSNQDETMSLSANGTQSVFLRQPGKVRMDMDGVELLDLTPLTGADTVAVNDLTGTDFRRADIDLSNAGVGDGAVDSVTVNGTDAADHVNVAARGARVDVEGLQTETRITGSEATDHLQVNTLAGNDRAHLDPGVLPLIGVNVDLGTGQH